MTRLELNLLLRSNTGSFSSLGNRERSLRILNELGLGCCPEFDAQVRRDVAAAGPDAPEMPV
jgi:hypothetical protein